MDFPVKHEIHLKDYQKTGKAFYKKTFVKFVPNCTNL